MLLDLASSVRSLCIRQPSHYSWKNQESNYFLGLKNVEWGSVISDMFSRKLEKLQIVNEPRARLLDKTSFKFLKEVCHNVKMRKRRMFQRLPKLSKKIWFDSSSGLDAKVVFDKIDEYHIARSIFTDNGFMDVLKIKHISKQNEGPDFQHKML